MSESTTNISLAKVPDSLDKAAEGLLVKPATTLGNTISSIFDLVFGALPYLAEKQKLKYEHKLSAYKTKLENAIDKIPVENKAEPNLQVAGQAIEDSKFCIETDELITMFIKLISSSLNKNTQSDVHPSFSQIIKQMTPLDAYVLMDFKKYPELPICNYKLCFPDNTFTTLSHNVFMNYSGEYLSKNLNALCISIASLCRLGLLEITWNYFSSNDSSYDIFFHNNFYDELKNTYEHNGAKIDITKGKIYLTHLGMAFCSTCIPDNFN